jgi:hypothetical protein
VSVPVPGGWLVSGSVRDDTVSTDRPVPVAAVPGAFLVLRVSFGLMLLIWVARRRVGWQPATRTAPGGAAVVAGSCWS